MTKILYIARPRGFCAGVNRAIKIVELALEKFRSPIYVNHEIVHNRFVVEGFKSRGVIFSDDLNYIPESSVYIFSAHGVSPIFRGKVRKKNLKIIDATCPLVTKVHQEAELFSRQGYKIFYIGRKNHQEYLGVSGVADMTLIRTPDDVRNLRLNSGQNQKAVCLSQTTLSQDDAHNIILALRKKIPQIQIPGDICYATQNRQKAVKKLAEVSDFILVMGSENSSNSNRLVSVAKNQGIGAQLHENVKSLAPEIFEREVVGLTAGASVPEILVQEVVDEFKNRNKNLKTKTLKVFEEKLEFDLPAELRQ